MTLDEQVTEEPRDRTRLLWLAVIVLFAAMAAAMWLYGRTTPKSSMVHAKHILIQFDANDATDRARALELIGSLRERIANGASFEATAREYSDDDVTRGRGGDLGYKPRKTFVPGFEEVAWSQPVGELSPVIETQHGFHLIVVEDRHLSEADRYDMELDERAREELRQERQQTEP